MKDYSNYYPSFKDILMHNGEIMFNHQLEDFDSKDISINGSDEVIKALINYHTNPINEFKENRKITVWHSININRGDIIETLDDNRVFMVISKVNENDMIKYALIREINHMLKWIDEDNNLITCPSIISFNNITGIDNEKIIPLPNGVVGIQIPYNDDTKKFDREQSFIFNKTKYTITFYNDSEYKGLILLMCTESLKNPSVDDVDDLENGIADRYIAQNGGKLDRLTGEFIPYDSQENIEPDNKIGIAYEIEGDYELFQDDINTYTIHKFIDGKEVEGNFTFSITNAELAEIKNVKNNVCSIYGNLDQYGELKLIVTDTETNEQIEKRIKVRGVFG